MDNQNLLNMVNSLLSKIDGEDTICQTIDYYDENENVDSTYNSFDFKELENVDHNKMKSILSNISSIQFDEDKEYEEDENKEFFAEIHDKIMRKMRVNLSDRKRMVELNLLDSKKYSLTKLSRLTGVKPNTICDWKNSYQDLCQQTNLKGQRIRKAAKGPVSEFEHEILNFIDKLREEKKPVNTNMIVAKMINLNPELKQTKKQTLQHRVYRFLKKNHYSIRKASHIGQPLPSRALDLFIDFFREINRKRHKLRIYDSKDDHDRLINIDETPIYFEMTSDKTINRKGDKVISVETKGNERKLISCVLACSAGGKKLMPALIFKGGKDGNLESRYKNLECVKNKKIAIYFQNNAWCDEYIFKKWVKDVYFSYTEEQIKKKCILIMDRSPSHIYRSKYLDKKGESYVFIPGGLTRYLQPLDIGVNKQFKSQLKDNYLNNLADNMGGNNDEKDEFENMQNIFGDGKAPSQLDEQRLNIIRWVIDVWWDDDKIKISSIINSFTKAGINYPLDGSKDVDFVFPEEVINQTI